jgi:MFS family permease
MSQPSAEPAISVGTLHPTVSETRLHGRWLVLARVGWIIVTVTLVILNIIALPDTYLAYFRFTPQQLQDLHRLGLSPTLYGILLTVENAPFQLVTLALGLLLFWRRSADRMALFCSFALVTFGNALPLYNFSNGSLASSLAANAVLRIITLVLFGAGEASFVIFFYLFPSGRFAPRWTRWCALVVVAYWLAVVFFPTLPSNAGGPATYMIPLALLSAVVAQVYRYWRVSTPRERQQTKWAVFGFALAILLIVITIPLGVLVPSSIRNDPVLGDLNPIFAVTLPLIPIFLAIAVLRSRLWDIDTLINKALVYGSLTAILALLYAGMVLGLQALLAGLLHQTTPIALIVSTLAIYVLFQPVRTRLQALIDQRFYRRKYDAEKTLAAFSATLRNEVDLATLSEEILMVVNETMQPTHVSLWLRAPQQYVGTVSYGTEQPETRERDS